MPSSFSPDAICDLIIALFNLIVNVLLLWQSQKLLVLAVSRSIYPEHSGIGSLMACAAKRANWPVERPRVDGATVAKLLYDIREYGHGLWNTWVVWEHIGLGLATAGLAGWGLRIL